MEEEWILRFRKLQKTLSFDDKWSLHKIQAQRLIRFNMAIGDKCNRTGG